MTIMKYTVYWYCTAHLHLSPKSIKMTKDFTYFKSNQVREDG